MEKLHCLTSAVFLYVMVQVNSAGDDELIFASIQEMNRLTLACDDFMEFLKDFEIKHRNQETEMKKIMPVKNAINGIDFKENLLAIITVILNVKRILNSGEHLEGFDQLKDKSNEGNFWNISNHMSTLFNLQDFYKASPKYLSNQQLSGRDFFNIGNYALDDDDPERAMPWLKEAKKQLDKEKKYSNISEISNDDMLTAMGLTNAMLKELDTAKKVFREIQKKFKSYTEVRSLELDIIGGLFRIVNGSVERKALVHDWGYNVSNARMQSLCRRKTYYTEPKQELHCISFPLYPYYFVREEILSNNPVIMQVYDAVTNSEATLLKESPDEYLEDILIQDKIVNKIKKITSSQLVRGSISRVHYSLGEFVKLEDFHTELSTEEKADDPAALIILNQATRGGKMVFPSLKLSINITKNSLLLVDRALHQSEPNPYTVCPIIEGSVTILRANLQASI